MEFLNAAFYQVLKDSGITYLFFLQHHKIEMFYSILGVPGHALDELVLPDHFTNILINKRISINWCPLVR